MCFFFLGTGIAVNAQTTTHYGSYTAPYTPPAQSFPPAYQQLNSSDFTAKLKPESAEYSYLYPQLRQLYELAKPLCSQAQNLKFKIGVLISQHTGQRIDARQSDSGYGSENLVSLDPEAFSKNNGRLEFAFFHECCHAVLHYGTGESTGRRVENEANLCALKELERLKKIYPYDPRIKAGLDLGYPSAKAYYYGNK